MTIGWENKHGVFCTKMTVYVCVFSDRGQYAMKSGLSFLTQVQSGAIWSDATDLQTEGNSSRRPCQGSLHPCLLPPSYCTEQLHTWSHPLSAWQERMGCKCVCVLRRLCNFPYSRYLPQVGKKYAPPPPLVESLHES